MTTVSQTGQQVGQSQMNRQNLIGPGLVVEAVAVCGQHGRADKAVRLARGCSRTSVSGILRSLVLRRHSGSHGHLVVVTHGVTVVDF